MKQTLILITLGLTLLGCSIYDNQPYPAQTPTPTQAPFKNYKQIVRQYPPPNTLESKKNIFTSISRIAPTKVALLVPLTGKYKKLGQNMLDAAQLAIFAVNEPNLILLPLDTKGTSYGAVEAINQAIAEEAKLILGPIFSKSTSTIAPIAAENNINIVSFSNDASLANTGVFTLGVRPEQQIRRVTEFAMEQQIEDFTAILPNNSYGATAAKELRETVAENDMASVLKTEIFRTDSKGRPLHLSKHIYSALSSARNTKPPKDYDEELKAYNYNPIKFPRAMLIPEGGQQLKQITNLLTKYNLDPNIIQLLGSSQWYKPEVLNIPLLNGAWFAMAPNNRRQKFINHFNNNFGYKPIKLASLAYDGIALAATIARISGTNEYNKEHIANPRGFIGVDGIFRFMDNGLTERGLAVMKIQDGEFQVISPAPNNFYDIQRFQEPSEETPS